MILRSHTELETPGMIYMVACESGRSDHAMHVKTGWSRNPFDRVSALQIGCPLGMDFIWLEHAERDREAELHRKYSDFRGIGEWFLFSRESCREYQSNLFANKEILKEAARRSMKHRAAIASATRGFTQMFLAGSVGGVE